MVPAFFSLEHALSLSSLPLERKTRYACARLPPPDTPPLTADEPSAEQSGHSSPSVSWRDTLSIFAPPFSVHRKTTYAKQASLAERFPDVDHRSKLGNRIMVEREFIITSLSFLHASGQPRKTSRETP